MQFPTEKSYLTTQKFYENGHFSRERNEVNPQMLAKITAIALVIWTRHSDYAQQFQEHPSIDALKEKITSLSHRPFAWSHASTKNGGDIYHILNDEQARAIQTHALYGMNDFDTEPLALLKKTIDESCTLSYEIEDGCILEQENYHPFFWKTTPTTQKRSSRSLFAAAAIDSFSPLTVHIDLYSLVTRRITRDSLKIQRKPSEQKDSGCPGLPSCAMA